MSDYETPPCRFLNIISLALIISFFLPNFLITPQAARAENAPSENVMSIADGIIDYMKSSFGASHGEELFSGAFLELCGTTAGDWFPIAFSRLGVSDGYAAYLAVLRDYVEKAYRKDEKLSAVKATEWHRISLAVLASGGDPESFGADKNGKEINLIADGTYDRGKTAPLGRQGINALIWGLITLDSKRYAVPSGACTAREDIIAEILSGRLSDGGFALGGAVSDADITAMAIQALAPYYNDEKIYTYVSKETGVKTESSVRCVVDEALLCLSEMQLDGGDYASWGTENAESTAQVIIALCCLGIDPLSDGRFIKNGNTLLDGLLRYRRPDGGFTHSYDADAENPASEPGVSNFIATSQALLAAAALWRHQNNMRSLYDFRAEETAAEDGFLSSESSEYSKFTEEDEKTLLSLPEAPTVGQYVTVTALLEKLERTSEFDFDKDKKEKYIQKLCAMKEKIEEIQREIDSLNGEILENIYPIESISLRDKKTVDSICERYFALSEYDRTKIGHWDDVVKAKAQIESLTRSAAVSAAAVAVLFAVFVFLARRLCKRRRRAKDGS